MPPKPKALFLIDAPLVPFEDVYDDAARRRLAERLEIPDGPVSSAALAADPTRFREVRLVLSTWGVPSLPVGEWGRLLPALEAVFYAAGSVQAFAGPLLARGVRVFSAWGENAVPVAEMAAAQILLANKGWFQAQLRTKTDYAAGRAYASRFPGNYQERVGLLGAGRIGALVARFLQAHDLEVLVYDPFLPDADAALLGVRKASLEEIFSTCRTISNHLADKPETKGLLDGRLFERMYPDATFLNTGRGATVVEEDLLRALRDAPDRTAVLDVVWPEPPDPARFRDVPNVFLSPHIAGSLNRECLRMGDAMADEVVRYLDGAPSVREVTAAMLAAMA
jgi:phosphoglycerate dehydrogenase-like enzyme